MDRRQMMKSRQGARNTVFFKGLPCFCASYARVVPIADRGGGQEKVRERKSLFRTHKRAL
jgi:hypothetical protein